MTQLSALNGVAEIVFVSPNLPQRYRMTPNLIHRLDRRAFLKGAAAGAALLSSTSLSSVALGQAAEPEPFDFDVLAERMRALAGRPFHTNVPPLPKLFASLDYDGYRKIQFDAQHARWLDNNSGFQVHAFPMGWLFKEAVGVFEVAEGKALPPGARGEIVEGGS